MSLTANQEAFAQGIAKGMSYADAYRSAYKTERMTQDSIYVEASKLKDNPKVALRLKELRDMAAKPTIMTAQERKEWLTRIIQDPDIDIKSRLSASDQLNKMDGEYVQKVQAEVQTETTINIELVDDDEC